MISTFFEVFLIFLFHASTSVIRKTRGLPDTMLSPADAYRKKLQGSRLKKLQNQETLKAGAV